MEASLDTCGLSVPPAIEKPRPALPRSREMSSYSHSSWSIASYNNNKEIEEKQKAPGWLQQKQNVAVESSVVLGCSALLVLWHFEVRDHGSGWQQQLNWEPVKFREI